MNYLKKGPQEARDKELHEATARLAKSEGISYGDAFRRIVSKEKQSGSNVVRIDERAHSRRGMAPSLVPRNWRSLSEESRSDLFARAIRTMRTDRELASAARSHYLARNAGPNWSVRWDECVFETLIAAGYVDDETPEAA